MAVCPHCQRVLDDSKKYITCPHCGRVTKSIDECVDIILSSSQLENLIQKASVEYWKIIDAGLRQIMFMDEGTYLAVRDKLFSLPENRE